MRKSLEEQAWSIVSGLNQLISSDRTLTSLEKTEAVRLSGLTYAISDIMDYEFSELCFEAERLGASQSAIMGAVNSGLESYKGPNLSEFTHSQITTLLGLIHSIGSYQLPIQYNHGTSQRPLGAYYTPQHIADHIVSLTLTPTLDRLSIDASTKGINALEKIKSLRTLDPACGTGVFLVSALGAYVKAMKKGIRNAKSSGASNEDIEAAGLANYRKSVQQNLYGVDLDAGALEITDISLRLISGGLNDSTSGACLKKGNSLVSLKGLQGNQNHHHFYSNPNTRHPFEWRDEFEEVMSSGGFDFIVMNPPYERLKPNLAEFLRERISTGDREIQLNEFDVYKEELNEDLKYYRKSGEYQLGNRYTIDVHRLFIERAIQLSRIGGQIGFIVPSTILGDLSSHPLRKSILLENRLITVNDFPETSRLFNGVTQSVSVLSLEKGGTTESFIAQFGLRDIDNTSDVSKVRIQTEKIKKVGGQFYSIPQVNESGWGILEKFHSHPSVLSTDWVSVNRGELDLTLNRSCIIHKETEHRLIRGSDISRYNLLSRTSRPEEYVNLTKLKESMKTSTRIDHVGKPRIACQQVSNRTQRWRLKFADIPSNTVLANSCNYMHIPSMSHLEHLPLLLGLLNSELMNWRFELTNTNNHVSTRELSQLPIPEIGSISRKIIKDLITEVKSVRIINGSSSPRIESLVFSLYGFTKRDARIVLWMRKTPETEMREILEGMLV
ncbi:MAG: Eco57I restriction-modification methylase domain-containing protein [Candidatus Thorarchaeota archaeon]